MVFHVGGELDLCVPAGPTKPPRKKKNKKRKVEVPPEIAADPDLAKYWVQRYRLFSRFDEGIQLDTGE